MRTDDFKMSVLRGVLAENKQLTDDVAIALAAAASKAVYTSISDYMEIKKKIKKLTTCNAVVYGNWCDLPNGLCDMWNKGKM